jgi:hypothetical protein
MFGIFLLFFFFFQAKTGIGVLPGGWSLRLVLSRLATGKEHPLWLK